MKRIVFTGIGALFLASAATADPLPSWADTATKSAIIEFVEQVTDPASDRYVAPANRIATFDNDGTLWAEQPLYFQLIYALDRLREKVDADPAILTSDILRAGAEGDIDTIAAGGAEALVEILAVSHAGMTTEDFQADVLDWLETARHPSTGKRYDDMVYQPMLELLRYLRDEEFQTWIVSGGGVHFIRAFAADTYGIPTEQVIGTTGPTEYVDGEVRKLPGIDFVDDKAGKPVGIDSRIGKRPILVGGNSDGDFEMLEYASNGNGPSLGIIVHHTDAAREFAYDREGHVGVLNRGLDEGPDRGWIIIDMATDWRRVWPE